MVKWLTHLQIGWIAVFGMKTMIRENDCAIFVALDQGLKGAVMDIGRITLPIDHLAEMVEQETQLPAHNPAPVGVAFSANLLRRTTLANGMDQLNAVAINDTQDPRLYQEGFCLRVWMACLFLMGLNLSNEQIADELDLPLNEAQAMTSQLREGVVVKKVR